MDITEFLKKSDLFKNFNDKELNILKKNAVIKNLDQKEMLFSEGSEGLYFFIVLKGSLRLFKTSIDGKESTIKIINSGEMIAEAILFGKNEYPACAVATETSEIIGIHRDSFREMLNNTDSRDAFINAVFNKLRFLTDQIHYLSSYDVEDRFFRFLSTGSGKKYKYNITIPKKDIASAIGTIPETFSRLILRLTRMKIINWEKNILTIRDGFWDNDYLE
jgi:CRP-like cAMP-binding protein